MDHTEFNERFRNLVRDERAKTNEILRMINECSKTRGYFKLGYPSLFAWLVKGHGYSESAAYRRMAAAQLIDALPEVSARLESGEVSLTQAAKVQSVIRTQEIAGKNKVSAREKSAALMAVQGKTKLQAEQTLLSLFPAAQSHVSQQRTTAVNDETVRLSFNVSKAVMNDLVRAKEILSHAIPTGNHGEILARLLTEFLNRKDPLRAPARRSVSFSRFRGGEELRQ